MRFLPAFSDAALAILENPGELYRRADDEQRRQLNQALFEQVLVDDDLVVDVVHKVPFAELALANRAYRHAQAFNPEHRLETALQFAQDQLGDDNPIHEKTTLAGGLLNGRVLALLTGIFHAKGSSSGDMVGPTGLEPMTSTV
jgi:site-specific DNA recombinase